MTTPASPSPPGGAPPEHRLEQVESLLTHLQHELDKMSGVLIAQTAELEALRRRCDKLQAGLDRLEDDPEPSDLAAHVPPHWGGGVGREGRAGRPS